jgi:hypothetical protein
MASHYPEDPDANLSRADAGASSRGTAMNDNDLRSRTRPGKQPFPGPREVRYLLELTLAYAGGLKDVIGVISQAVVEHPELTFRYAALLDHLHSLVSPGDGGLVAIEHECRVLLGEAGNAE